DDARMAPLEPRRPDAGWTAIADPRQIAPCRPPLATARAPDGDRARWAAAGREPGGGQPALPPARRPPATPRDAREPRPPGRARPRGDPHRGPQLVPGRALEPARALHHAGRALSRLPPPLRGGRAGVPALPARRHLARELLRDRDPLRNHGALRESPAHPRLDGPARGGRRGAARGPHAEAPDGDGDRRRVQRLVRALLARGGADRASAAGRIRGPHRGDRAAPRARALLCARRRAHLVAGLASPAVRDARVLRAVRPSALDARARVLGEPADAVPGRHPGRAHGPAGVAAPLRVRAAARDRSARRRVRGVPRARERGRGAGVRPGDGAGVRPSDRAAAASPAARAEHLAKRFHVLRAERTALRALRALLRGESLRRELWVLKDVSFEIARGAKVALVGRNGSGKTTLLRLLSGIYAPTAGRLEVADRPRPL